MGNASLLGISQRPETNPFPPRLPQVRDLLPGKIRLVRHGQRLRNGGEGVADFVKVSPLPKYLEAPESYKASFADWDNKVKGEYPHPAHASSLSASRFTPTATTCLGCAKLCKNPVFINKQDAEERGIKTGDTVRVFNEQGQFLRPARLPGPSCRASS